MADIADTRLWGSLAHAVLDARRNRVEVYKRFDVSAELDRAASDRQQSGPDRQAKCQQESKSPPGRAFKHCNALISFGSIAFEEPDRLPIARPPGLRPSQPRGSQSPSAAFISLNARSAFTLSAARQYSGPRPADINRP